MSHSLLFLFKVIGSQLCDAPSWAALKAALAQTSNNHDAAEVFSDFEDDKLQDWGHRVTAVTGVSVWARLGGSPGSLGVLES